jgi:hypothetical protein
MKTTLVVLFNLRFKIVIIEISVRYDRCSDIFVRAAAIVVMDCFVKL